MKVQILVDHPTSWIVPGVRSRIEELARSEGRKIRLIHDHESIEPGDVLFLLSCEKLLKVTHRALNRHNLVVHESDLPRGRGWSPLTWSVLQGETQITVSLIEAAEAVDSGPIYAQKKLKLKGTELIDELRELQLNATWELILEFIEGKHAVAREQKGEATYLARRKPEDSRIDPEKTIAEQFDLLRVVDNERYPAFFDFRGERYFLRISKK